MYQEKIEGQPCQNCQGGKYVRSPKTGKVFCDKKCWLSGQPQSPQTQNFAPQQAQTPQGIDLHQFITKTEYNAILDKQRTVFTKMQEQINEIIKTQNYLREMLEVNKPTAFEVHKEDIPIIGAENFVEDASKILDIK